MGYGERMKRKGRGLWDFLRHRGKLWLLIGGALLGVMLLILGGADAKESETTSETEVVTQADAADLMEYQKVLESQLEALCNAVAGVSKAEVAITLGSGYRMVYVTDSDGKLATTGAGSSEQAVYRTLQPPTVVGVGIVCKEGDDAHVQMQLTELISTTLGITTNRVCITGK